MASIQQQQAQQQVNLTSNIKKILSDLNTKNDSTTFSTYIDAPKFAQLKRKLIDVAPSWGVKLRFTDNDRRWIRETIYFDVIGKRKDVIAFWAAISNSMAEYNGELEP